MLSVNNDLKRPNQLPNKPRYPHFRFKLFRWRHLPTNPGLLKYLRARILQSRRSKPTHPVDRNSSNYLRRGLLLLPLPKNNPHKPKTITHNTSNIPTPQQHKPDIPLQRNENQALIHKQKPKPTQNKKTEITQKILGIYRDSEVTIVYLEILHKLSSRILDW
jgi:hypothetical protein